MTIIKPTIGRRVHYWPSQGDLDCSFSVTRVSYLDVKQPCDAGVVFVHNDRCVNLQVNDHSGTIHRRPAVRLVQPGDEPAMDGEAVCTWMPYQLEQASKDSPTQPPPEPTDDDAWAVINEAGAVTKLDIEATKRVAHEHPDSTIRMVAKLVLHAYGMGLDSAPSARVE